MKQADDAAEREVDDTRLTMLVRDECIARLLAAAQDAAIRGVCAEGQLEAVISALRQQDANELLRAARGRAARSPHGGRAG